MNIKVISGDFNQNLYNAHAIHPLQAWEWGEARKKMGIEVLRFGEFRGNKLIDVYQVTLHQIPSTVYKVGYLPRSTMPSDEVLEFLYDFSKQNNVVFIKIEPYERENSNVKAQMSKLKRQAKNYSIIESGHPLFPRWTLIVDLRKSEDDLLKSMKPKTRYNVKLAQRKGVTVQEATNREGFEIFAALYFETCKRQRYLGHDYAYHRMIFETLKNNIVHILIASYQNTPLAAYELFTFGGITYYVYGGSSEKFRSVMASHLLMWESIRFAKKLGSSSLDMWGSLPPTYSESHSWAGFTRFKEGFGGEFVELCGSYDLVISRYLYRIYSTIYKIREVYLNLLLRSS
ncbi:peptidoglycan bridge formation glycyltransferase FemA/FemB family protein [Candidatus Roizmanbacteria bacterium]|nr:peptidoglycan bridge formation glycyltransferase FemA/FemB family protein [Candidatus Roizmanbacteria bacterium]